MSGGPDCESESFSGAHAGADLHCNRTYEENSALDSRKNHLRFHRGLAELTDNEMLIKTLNRINLFWVLCKALGARASKTQYPRYWHRKLLDEINTGDPERAEKAMREHILDSLGPILATLPEKEEKA